MKKLNSHSHGVTKFIVASSLLMGSYVSQSFADTYTYAFNTGLNTGPLHLTGTIVTDGIIGQLTPTDILSWNFSDSQNAFSISSSNGNITCGSPSNCSFSPLYSASTPAPGVITNPYSLKNESISFSSAASPAVYSLSFINNALHLSTFNGYGYTLVLPLASGTNLFLLTNIAPVPEPEVYVQMLAGLGLVGFLSRRCRRS